MGIRNKKKEADRIKRYTEKVQLRVPERSMKLYEDAAQSAGLKLGDWIIRVLDAKVGAAI